MRHPPHEDETCGDCDYPIEVKEGRFGEFVGCTRFPACGWTRSIEDPKREAPSGPGPSGDGRGLAPSAWHYLYCDSIIDSGGHTVGMKFGHSNHPFRRVQEHRENVPGADVRVDIVLRGEKKDVLVWESLLKAHTLKQGWALPGLVSGEWIEPRTEIVDMFEACAGRPSRWQPHLKVAPLHPEMESAGWSEARHANGRARKLDMVKRGDQSVLSLGDLKAMIRLAEEEREAKLKAESS